VDDIQFEWDEEKARSNERKHGVTFGEASTVFGDRLGRLLQGAGAGEETRDVIIGLSAMGGLLVVVFMERGRIRIISARRATPFQRYDYEEAGG
jgi:uncharacterized DUF497 family protein